MTWLIVLLVLLVLAVVVWLMHGNGKPPARDADDREAARLERARRRARLGLDDDDEDER